MIPEILFYILVVLIPVFAGLSIKANTNLKITVFYVIAGIGVSLLFVFKGLLFLTILNLAATFTFSGIMFITVPYNGREKDTQDSMRVFQKSVSLIFVTGLFIALCSIVLSVPGESFKQIAPAKFTHIDASGLYLIVIFATISLIAFMGIFRSERGDDE